jgi:hypothetical protein
MHLLNVFLFTALVLVKTIHDNLPILCSIFLSYLLNLALVMGAFFFCLFSILELTSWPLLKSVDWKREKR